MHRPGRNRLESALCRLLPPPVEGIDADLLGRYADGRDAAAFEAIVRRHGPMVLGVCRRELGPGPDAADAFQVAFLVLARDARRIRRPDALPGWLHRVARLAALKVRAKRRADFAVREDDAADPSDPPRDAADREFSAALDRELAALSDKLRATFVLCCLEDRSSGEAARILGCPVGTVESRLAAARARLRDRLARRGFGLPAIGLAVVAADAAAVRLTSDLMAATATYTAGGGSPDPLFTLADGVTPIMATAKLKLLAAAGMSLALFGTAGVGLYQASADDPQPVAQAKAEPANKAAATDPPAKPAEQRPPELQDERAVRAVLSMPVRDLPPTIPLKQLLDVLHERFGLNARLDTASFKRLGGSVSEGMAATVGPDRFHVAAVMAADPEVESVMALYETQIALPVTRGMTVADVLGEAVSQLPGKCSYRVRGNQLLIAPAFRPPVLPGSGRAGEPGMQVIPADRVLEQIVGEPVSISIEERSLSEAVKELRRLTGANIVIDNRYRDNAGNLVSGTFDDTRLLTVLTILADQCELKPVAMNGVYYVTGPDNAAKLQAEINRDLFGDPIPPPNLAEKK